MILLQNLPETKICNRCKVEKVASEFRIRREKRGSSFYYLNTECKQCDKERAAIYYAKKKNDPDFQNKNRERVREYREKHIDQINERRSTQEYREMHNYWAMGRYEIKKDEINAKMKIKRQSPEYKEKMKAYREKNKEKIAAQEKITKRRYQEKNMTSISDKYVAARMGITVDKIPEIKEKMPEILELKRLKIQLDRAIKGK